MPAPLILEAVSRQGELTVSLSQHGSTMHRYERASASPDTLLRQAEALLAILRTSNERGPRASSASEELRRLGQLLYDGALSPSIKRELAVATSACLIVRMDEPFIAIPWELLHDGLQFLALRFSLGRWVNTRQAAASVKERPVTIPLKMLVLADPAGDLSMARQEAGAIREALAGHARHLVVSTKTASISVEYVRTHLRDYDLVHYAGHATYDPTDASASGWRLADGMLRARDIVDMGSGASFPRLVFANACQSISGFGQLELFGLANAFLLSGVKHMIGTLWDVPDEASAILACAFYRQIALGRSVGEALQEARKALITQLGEECVAWAGYVLYGDPVVSLISPSERSASSTVKSFEQVGDRTVAWRRMLKAGLVACAVLAGTVVVSRLVTRPAAHDKPADARAHAQMAESLRLGHVSAPLPEALDQRVAQAAAEVGARIQAASSAAGRGEWQQALAQLAAAGKRLVERSAPTSGIDHRAMLTSLRLIADAMEATLRDLSPEQAVSDEALRATRALMVFDEMLGRFKEAIRDADLLIADDQRRSDQAALCADEQLLARLFARAQQYQQSVLHAQQSVAVAQRIAEPRVLARAYLTLAESLTEERVFSNVFGEVGAAEGVLSGDQDGDAAASSHTSATYYRQAQESAAAAGQEGLAARALKGVGYCAQLTGERSEAADAYERAVAMLESLQKRSTIERLTLAGLYVNLAALAIAGEVDLRRASASLERLERLLSVEREAWSASAESSDVVRAKLQAFLDLVSLKGYRHSDLFQQAVRLSHAVSDTAR